MCGLIIWIQKQRAREGRNVPRARLLVKEEDWTKAQGSHLPEERSVLPGARRAGCGDLAAADRAQH